MPTCPLPADCQSQLPDGSQQVESQVNADFDQLANLLTLGSYFVICCKDGNEEGMEYYLLQCTGEFETLNESRLCIWADNDFRVGDTVVTGKYMRRFGRTPKKYRWDPNRMPTTIVSHLVIGINLPLFQKMVVERKHNWRPARVVPVQVVYNFPEDQHEALLHKLTEPSHMFSACD